MKLINHSLSLFGTAKYDQPFQKNYIVTREDSKDENSEPLLQVETQNTKQFMLLQ
jgi:hypothetical protein